MKVSELFYLEGGNGFSLNNMDQSKKEVCFVSRTTKNNGVSSKVKKVDGIEPFEGGLITVALSGNGVLESFVQPYCFYTGYHVMVLTPKVKMSLQQKIYYCICIKKNRYKYSYGRQANRSLANLELPDRVPTDFEGSDLEVYDHIEESINNRVIPLDVSSWKAFKLEDLFDIQSGKGVLLKQAKNSPGSTPMVTATRLNNGVSLYTDFQPTHRGGVITLVKNGNNVGKAFYQPSDFISTSDMSVLTPKFKLNRYNAMFLITLIEKQKFKYNYARKWGMRLIRSAELKLPTINGKPDWGYMENFIKTLKYSKVI